MVKLVWNAIVKNEAAVIERCVNALLPHIDGAVIVDTGSTDGTPELIRGLFAKALVPVEIHEAPFEHFEQARNEALRCARKSTLEWDYLLLADADMELKVHKPNWINGAQGPSYDLKQKSGALRYNNRRLLSRRAGGWYVGVTHEYLDVESAGALDGAEFVDHADGANRSDKFSRDIALLEKALETETRPGLIQRYHFYLAASYYDSGDHAKAARYYAARVQLGGFEQEAWYALLRYALCMKQMGLADAFVLQMLKAHQRRPQRAEPLYELAKYYRENSEHHLSLLFAERGMQLPKSSDTLFVNEWVQRSGLKEEFAICAYYDLAKRDRGFKVCNELALAGSVQARSNLFWYLQPLSKLLTTFTTKPIEFEAPEGWVAMNPSITTYKGNPWMIVRTVNYVITPEGEYAIRSQDGRCDRDNPIRTRNYLCGLAPTSLTIGEIHELALPPNWPEPKYWLVRGFEDSRLFEHKGELWTISTVRELEESGICQQVVAPLDPGGYTDDWMVFESHQNQHEKNWMPWPRDGEMQFVYRPGSLISTTIGSVGFHCDPGFNVSRISGGSQVVQVDERTWVAVVHETCILPGRHNRFYLHRFVAFRSNGAVDRISQPFYLHDKQIEFVSGLAMVGKKLVMSYGVRDCEAWLATMDPDDVIKFIYRDSL